MSTRSVLLLLCLAPLVAAVQACGGDGAPVADGGVGSDGGASVDGGVTLDGGAEDGGSSVVAGSLASLQLSVGTLSPAFSPSVTAYAVSVAGFVDTLRLLPVAPAGASVTINDVVAQSGVLGAPVPLAPASVTTITVRVTPTAGTTRAYTLAVVRGEPAASYLKASNAGAGDELGTAVALSGDTLAVSAPGEDSAASGVGGDQADEGAAERGAVYVFRRAGRVWTQEAYLKPSDAGAGGRFGFSLALSGDTLVVGSAARATYVFRRAAGVWRQEARLQSSGPFAGDRFGFAVAVEGDTLAVGAVGDPSAAAGVGASPSDGSAPDSGAVYIFARSASGWAQQAYLKASNPGAGDLFGSSLSLSGDALAVGAYGEASSAAGVGANQADDSAPDAGAVYVFRRAGAAWSQEAYLKASNAGEDVWFGYSLSLSGDTLAVGAPREDSAATGIDGDESDESALSAGAVYVFVRGGVPATWRQQAYVKASNTWHDSSFGESVALQGDTLAVGAIGESSDARGADGSQTTRTAGNSGAVYLFTRVGAAWSQRHYLKAPNSAADFAAGNAIAVSPDTVILGVAFEDGTATGVGGDPSRRGAARAGAVFAWGP